MSWFQNQVSLQYINVHTENGIEKYKKYSQGITCVSL